MPLYLLRPGCWFRFANGAALYAVVRPGSLASVRCRVVGTNYEVTHWGAWPVEIAEEGPR